MKFVAGRRLRILDFDIENRPLSYWQPDRPTAEITAIAACWVDDPKSMKVWILGRDSTQEILTGFLEMYEQADMVSGHYITRHDLPIVNAMLMEEQFPLLTPILADDTKTLMVKKADIPATQEHLLDMYGIPVKKYHMTQAMWREANRLTPDGIAFTETRVTEDVRGHILLRKAMREAGALHAPRLWRP